MADDELELELLDVVEATFKPVRLDDLRPELVKYIGWRGLFEVTGHIDETTRSDGAYAGQLMMTPYRHDEWFGWMPDSDLEIHRVLSREEAHQEHIAYMTGHRVVVDTESKLSVVNGSLTVDPSVHQPCSLVVTYPGVPATGYAVQEEDGRMVAYTIIDDVWTEIQSLPYDWKVDHISTYIRDGRPVMERVVDDEAVSVDRELWLNGWPRLGSSVLIGVGVHCLGCGRSYGIATVAFDEDYVEPEKLPDWPFNVDTCPICQTVGRQLTVDDISQLDFSTLRQAIQKKKSQSGNEESKDAGA